MNTAWPEVRLDLIAEVRLGRQRSPKDHQGPTMRPYVRAANVGWSGLLLDDVKTMNFTDDELVTYRLQPGDLLLNEASGSQREVGKPAIWNSEIEDCAFQNTLLRVRPHGADARYLLHFFKQQASTGALARKSRGVGIHHLGREALACLQIPLPPIEEQQRIAAVLDLADALRARRRTAQILLNSLTKSIFLDMFGDRRSNKLACPVVLLSELVDPAHPITRGIDQPGPDVRGGVPYIKTTDFKGPISRDALARSATDIAGRFPRSVLRAGDSVICIRATVGPVALINESLAGVNLSRGTARVAPAQDVVPRFLYSSLSSQDFQDQITERLRGATFLQIPLGELRDLKVLRPPVDAQAEFAERAAAAFCETTLARGSLRVLDELFASLQHRAFSGRL